MAHNSWPLAAALLAYLRVVVHRNRLDTNYAQTKNENRPRRNEETKEERDNLRALRFFVVDSSMKGKDD